MIYPEPSPLEIWGADHWVALPSLGRWAQDQPTDELGLGLLWRLLRFPLFVRFLAISYFIIASIWLLRPVLSQSCGLTLVWSLLTAASQLVSH